MESIHVKLNEVVLRDGLQLEDKILSIEEKLEIYAALKKAGIQSFEFGAFVHPKRVPQMANSGEFFSRIEKDKAEASLIALIPNLKGAERAREAGVQTVNYVLSISDSHNLQNVQQPTAKSLEDLKEIRWYCGKNGMVLNVSCATTFGCPFEGGDSGRAGARNPWGNCAAGYSADHAGGHDRHGPSETSAWIDEANP
ncbi:hypothetical protein FK545_02650 [Planococcus glaciei]|nr:hypothetical protein [Planococcus glaciei]QDY44813.1 hypothetical protein FK545_02650 [Planococcus glaciei]